MQKNEIVQLKIESLGINGEGVARHENMVVFVPFALPNEIINAKITDVKKNFAKAELIEIISVESSRCRPKCEYFKTCGGCNIQHLTYSDQLKFKQNLVKNNLTNIAKINCKINPCVASENEFFYRNKVSLPICEKGVGMFEQSTNTIIPIQNCLIVSSWVQKLIQIFNNWFFANKITAYNRKTGSGVLRHLVARYENNSLLVCLVSTARIKNLTELAQQLSHSFSSFGLFQNINTHNSSLIFSNNFLHIAGIKQINQTAFGLNYPVSIGSFEQVNPQVSKKIYKQVCAEISGEKVVNAYSGAGLLSGVLSKNAKQVIAIELDKNAHKNAEELKLQNKITNLTNICGDCAEELKKVGEFDAIVLDPPRTGCDIKVIETINVVAPKKIVYISCDSATLARDISRLADYKIKSVTPYDMFPQTKHVETVCVLELNS